jgi:hypothetical protein
MPMQQVQFVHEIFLIKVPKDNGENLWELENRVRQDEHSAYDQLHRFRFGQNGV